MDIISAAGWLLSTTGLAKLFLEQRIGCRSVAGSEHNLRLTAGNLALQHLDTLLKLGDRKRVQILLDEFRQRIVATQR